MPVYRLEIDRGDTLWITAHDERGALEIATAHILDETEIDQGVLVQLKRDEDDSVVFCAAAGEWSPAVQIAPGEHSHSQVFSITT